ncbi:uncharacterized protein [Asterias amurensis]|uniref:uncharacterized protein n=1 Tax=Asterias amurensis TaxID=7602 RepID=UPI003AB3602A
MAHCAGMLLEINLLIFVVGVLVWFCPLYCWCLNLTVLNLQGMQASQVSTYRLKEVDLKAELAIDGDLRTNALQFHCSHTSNEPHAWWKLDLGANHCLGRITLVNRDDCCSYRLSGAIVRAGTETDIFNNAVCGLPLTSDQASIPGAHIQLLCSPPVTARYVSVETANTELTLCEVMVEEYPTEECPQTTTPTTIAGTILSSLFSEGKCIVNPRPLSVVHTKSPMQCFLRCKMFSECLSFEYVMMTTGKCRLYDVKAGDLNTDDELGCLVYAVVRG